VPADDEERWRVFLAIDVPDPVREALKEPLSALDPLRESLRLNAVERMHLTLHFLGHLPRTEVEKLPAALAPVVSRYRHFYLGAQGVGAFPGIGRPRVVWAGLAGADLPRLVELQRELGDGLRRADLAVEDRFHAHLTLARARRPLKAPERTVLRDWSARWESASFGDVPVDQVRLMRSQLGGGPARYTTLATFDLQ
jgi:2'-5' RNA ligase